MLRWRSLFLVFIFALALTACNRSQEANGVSTQPIELPTETIATIPTVISTASALPKLVVSKDTATVPANPPDTCPVTKPPDPPFTPPQPYPANPPGHNSSYGTSWYGTDSLWTTVDQNGSWYGLPHNPEGYTQKVFWWRKGYDAMKEPRPNLTVTGNRLDGDAPPLHASKASNAIAGDIGDAMLVGVDIPTLGCWEITGEYANAKLSFVVWVAP